MTCDKNCSCGDENTVIIPKEEYDELLKDQKFLRALEGAGVDNWDGYEYCLDSDN